MLVQAQPPGCRDEGTSFATAALALVLIDSSHFWPLQVYLAWRAAAWLLTAFHFDSAVSVPGWCRQQP